MADPNKIYYKVIPMSFLT